MRLPRIEELYKPILGSLASNGEKTIDGLKKDLMDYFFLTEADRTYDADCLEIGEEAIRRACDGLMEKALVAMETENSYSATRVGIYVYDNVKVIDEKALSEILSPQQMVQAEVLTQMMREDGRIIPAPQRGAVPAEKAYSRENIHRFLKVPQRIEYLPQMTLNDLIEGVENDTRLSNMIDTGRYVYKSGTLVALADYLSKGAEDCGDACRLFRLDGEIWMDDRMEDERHGEDAGGKEV